MKKKTVKRFKFEIRKSKWLRGEGNSCLLREEDGKMCCVGILGKALGVPKKFLLEIPTADDISPSRSDGSYKPHSKWPSWLYKHNETDGVASATQDAGFLYNVNDDLDTTDEYKQKRITTIFKRHGIDVKFIDDEKKKKKVVRT